MSAERCAYLSVRAVAANVKETWLARQPLLLFGYVAQYMPSTFSSVGSKAAQSRIRAFKSGADNINSGFFSSLFSSQQKKDK
jgi:dehydrogenase/reductase SDR family protein 7